jgi:hypothetical protein
MFTHWMVMFSVVVTRRLSWSRDERDERGDVPGWVLITLMTAGLVTALWVVAKGQLIDMFQSALASVRG